MFLMNGGYIAGGESYANFRTQADSYFWKGEEREYFDKWLEFMKELFNEVHVKRQKELNLMAKYLNELRERIYNIMQNRKHEKNIPEVVKELEKHEIVVGEMRYFLGEYFLTGNVAYVKMMCSCMGMKIN